MDLASLLTDTPTLGLTPGRRRWLGTGALVAMLVSFLALPVLFFRAAPSPEWTPPPEAFDRASAAAAALGASAIALACVLAWERGRGGVLAPLGVALAAAGLALAIVTLTAEARPGTSFWARQARTAVMLGAPAAFASLIALLGGGRRFPQVAAMASAAIVLLAALRLGASWGGTGDPALERVWVHAPPGRRPRERGLCRPHEAGPPRGALWSQRFVHRGAGLCDPDPGRRGANSTGCPSRGCTLSWRSRSR